MNEEFVRIRIEREPMSISIPYDWEIWEPPEGLVFLASDPIDVETFEPQITVSKERLSNKSDSRSYFVANYVGLKHRTKMFNDIGSGSFGVAGGEVAWLNYSAQIDVYDVTSMDFYVVADQTAYVINCKVPTADFPRWKELFEAVGESITIGYGADSE